MCSQSSILQARKTASTWTFVFPAVLLLRLWAYVYHRFKTSSQMPSEERLLSFRDNGGQSLKLRRTTAAQAPDLLHIHGITNQRCRLHQPWHPLHRQHESKGWCVSLHLKPDALRQKAELIHWRRALSSESRRRGRDAEETDQITLMKGTGLDETQMEDGWDESTSFW